MVTAQDLQIIFTIFYDNNVARYNQAFKDAGYSVPSSAIQAKSYVVKKIYDLYLNSPAKLNSIMSSIAWDYNANNYTNDPQVYARIQQFLQNNVSGYSNAKLNLGDLWGGFQTFLLGNQQTVTAQIVTTPVSNSGTTTAAVIGYVFLALAAVGLVIVAIKVMR